MDIVVLLTSDGFSTHFPTWALYDDRRISVSSDASPRASVASVDDFGALNAGNRDSGYDNFLSRVNRRIAKDSSNVPDPFMQSSSSRISMRPFSTYSHMSSVESIAMSL